MRNIYDLPLTTRSQFGLVGTFGIIYTDGIRYKTFIIFFSSGEPKKLADLVGSGGKFFFQQPKKQKPVG